MGFSNTFFLFVCLAYIITFLVILVNCAPYSDCPIHFLICQSCQTDHFQFGCSKISFASLHIVALSLAHGVAIENLAMIIQMQLEATYECILRLEHSINAS